MHYQGIHFIYSSWKKSSEARTPRYYSQMKIFHPPNATFPSCRNTLIHSSNAPPALGHEPALLSYTMVAGTLAPYLLHHKKGLLSFQKSRLPMDTSCSSPLRSHFPCALKGAPFQNKKFLSPSGAKNPPSRTCYILVWRRASPKWFSRRASPNCLRDLPFFSKFVMGSRSAFSKQFSESLFPDQSI